MKEKFNILVNDFLSFENKSDKLLLKNELMLIIKEYYLHEYNVGLADKMILKCEIDLDNFIENPITYKLTTSTLLRGILTKLSP